MYGTIIRNKIPEFQSTYLTIAHWEIGRGYYYFDKENLNLK